MNSDSLDMFRVITGRKFFFHGRARNLEEHYAKLRPQFVGQPEACFQLVMEIVRLRREIEVNKSWQRFNELLDAHIDLYVTHLNTRWLVSICDTVTDHGDSSRRSKALLISTVVNMIKLAETERQLSTNPVHDPAKVRRPKYTRFWNGMTPYGIKKGDMARQLLTRISTSIEDDVVLTKIWLAVLGKLKTSDTILLRLHKLHKGRGIFG